MTIQKAPASFAGSLHRYNNRLVAFEHTRTGTAPTNTLLWVGGLGDGLLTVNYPAVLASALPPTWSLVEVSTSASLSGWGSTTLARDAHEIAACVAYFQKLRGGKVVLMGHSTGCQDTMEYVTGADSAQRTPLNGAILQAPVSDREACEAGKTRTDFSSIIETSRQYVKEGRGDDVIPMALGSSIFGRTPVSAYRWLSLLSPDHDGDDDFFSSDLSDEQLRATFGRFPRRTPLLVLCSGSDQHVPKFVDVPKLVGRWTACVKSGGGVVDEENSGLVEGATHNLDGDDKVVVERLCRKVVSFLTKVESDEFSASASQL
ncbi:DUF1749-domain-containing protein [Microthyrium microscopicum]|uniref:DUF1749-domain-containing protein n=1 Tax=Microthyrium microscopicum TaxID=703497 RepID=A0A6A6UEK7_9PEZI|nr:DUF1749-domain-containing protein [Microthyrium microscopicum]